MIVLRRLLVLAVLCVVAGGAYAGCGRYLREERRARSEEALVMASFHGDDATVRRLLDRGIDPDTEGDRTFGTGTGLMLAARADHATTVSLLLDRGATINLRDSRGYTALMHAAEAGSLSTAKLLLARGADPTCRSSSGTTALSLAKMYGPSAGHTAIVQLLSAKHGSPAR
jgi:ankyrin repeat protein